MGYFLSGDKNALPKNLKDNADQMVAKIISREEIIKIDSAVDQYILGDDSELRVYIKNRVYVEIGSYITGASYGPPKFRSRKFSSPLYVTPAGYLYAYPENDNDLFMDMTQADMAMEFYKKIDTGFKSENMGFRMSTNAKLGKIGGKSYMRWLEEVKEKNYKEPRKTVEESHAIYISEGRVALEKIYSPGHIYGLIRKFDKLGFKILDDDYIKISHPMRRNRI